MPSFSRASALSTAKGFFMLSSRLCLAPGTAPVTRFRCHIGIACVVMASIMPFSSAGGRAGEIGFVETFALAEDREAVLATLVPGTEEWFYFHALHRLNTERDRGASRRLGEGPWGDGAGVGDPLTTRAVDVCRHP
jgi:hypothetical protein